MLVRVLDALVIAFTVFIFFGIGIRITKMPELSDELLAFFIGLQLGSTLSALRVNMAKQLF